MDDEPITALTSEEFSSRALRCSSATGWRWLYRLGPDGDPDADGAQHEDEHDGGGAGHQGPAGLVLRAGLAWAGAAGRRCAPSRRPGSTAGWEVRWPASGRYWAPRTAGVGGARPLVPAGPGWAGGGVGRCFWCRLDTRR